MALKIGIYVISTSACVRNVVFIASIQIMKVIIKRSRSIPGVILPQLSFDVSHPKIELVEFKICSFLNDATKNVTDSNLVTLRSIPLIL